MFLMVFLFGTVAGLVLSVDIAIEDETTSRIKKVDKKDVREKVCVCDACDSAIIEQDAIFCENCFEDDDKLNCAIKEKELEVRYVDMALRQRNLVNKPDSIELEKLRHDSDRVQKLYENVKQVSRDLDIKVDAEPLRERNESLRACINKWENINKREEKLDALLPEAQN